MLKKASICLYALLLSGVIAWRILSVPTLYYSVGLALPLKLTQQTFVVRHFPAKQKTRAVILFGSGDGGWGGVEEMVSRALQDRGYEVMGIDARLYATSDYNLDILQTDYARIAQASDSVRQGPSVPLILGGYSMGAAQAIAAAGGPRPPTGLVGLLLMDPCSRGRYGLRLSDQLDIMPTGPGTFAMQDFSHTMNSLKVVQWHAAGDIIDSRAWLTTLTAPHREFDFPGVGHEYGGNLDKFLPLFVDSAGWLLPAAPNDVTGRKVGKTP